MSTDPSHGFTFNSDQNDTVALGGDCHITTNSDDRRDIHASTMSNSLDQGGFYMNVDIPESKSEQDKVHFYVHTETNLPDMKPVSNVWRQYEEFVWLHDIIADSNNYAGLIIPPAPPKPEFEHSRAKLKNLSSLEMNITAEELDKMKNDIKQEYIASFKKTVTMHEVFLKRLAKHAKLRSDSNFAIFLQYEQPLSVRTQNRKEKATSFLRNLTVSIDETIQLAGKADSDDFFREERFNLLAYHGGIKEAAQASDIVSRARLCLLQSQLQVQIAWANAAQPGNLQQEPTAHRMSELKLYDYVAAFFDDSHKYQMKQLMDEDWKLNDTLKYYRGESEAAKMVLYHRAKLLSEYEQCSRALDKARSARKNIMLAETMNNMSFERFESISTLAKEELGSYLQHRVRYFDENLRCLAKLQAENSKKYADFVRENLSSLKKLTQAAPN